MHQFKKIDHYLREFFSPFNKLTTDCPLNSSTDRFNANRIYQMQIAREKDFRCQLAKLQV